MKLYKNSIPIGNIYYMLAYAFRDLQEQSIVSIDPEEFDNIRKLMAEIIIRGVSYQLKKGLLRSYENYEDELSTLKGKISISETVNKSSIVRRKLVCAYDEYTENTLMNMILKSVMLLLIRSDIKIEQIVELRRLVRYFGNVSEIQLANVKWDLLIYSRNNREYRLLMSVCRIICENMLHSTDDGDVKLVDFSDSDLNKLYEKFILNYYIKHHSDMSPDAPKIKWNFTGKEDKMFPEMRSDIVLTDDDKRKRLIIDAKFYSHTTQQHYGKDSFHSHNLYQIFTYVMNESAAFDGEVSGMLLYAKTKDNVILNDGCETEICGKKFYVRSLDLSGDFNSICSQLDKVRDRFERG